MIVFVGAGPGDPELVTVKGARLLEQADAVLFTGSLVRRALVDAHVRQSTETADSAGMTLAEMVEFMARHHERGGLVVRLHTGDPSLFGATTEQMRELQERGIPYSVVPGVSSFLAAAAALPAELTLPGVTQTVIVTRRAGRTPVPPGQDIPSLAAHRATMAIFLSAGAAQELQSELLTAYGAETPAAVVQRATWPEERVLRCTVGTLAATLTGNGIDRTAMILVGDALSGQGERSRLYDGDFEHGYRLAHGNADATRHAGEGERRGAPEPEKEEG